MSLLSRKRFREMPSNTCFSDGRRVIQVLSEVIPERVTRCEILNHHGLLSLKVSGESNSFKVAECESEKRAELASQAIRAVRKVDGPMPALIGRSGHVIIAEWADGEPLKAFSASEQEAVLLDCQASLVETPLPDPSDDIQYVHLLHLIDRLRRQGVKVVGRKRAEAVARSLWQRLPVPVEAVVIHPDLTPANVVVGDKGPVVIDNEVVGVGAGFEFDVWNTAESIHGYRDKALIRSYVEKFSELRCSPTLFSNEKVWDDFRNLRRGLKALEKKRFLKARRLVKAIDYTGRSAGYSS